MGSGLVERIADAVLYEGYILYPYRSSSVKNRQRFNFGVLVPQSYSVAQSDTEAWSMQTECLIQGNANATLDIKVRFLHLLMREVREMNNPEKEWREEFKVESRVVESLEMNGQVYQTWQEAVEREINARNINLSEVIQQPQQVMFAFPMTQESEPLRDSSQSIVGALVRRQEAVQGTMEIAAGQVKDDLYKVTMRTLNVTPFENAEQKSREEALMRSFASTHTILNVQGGEFVSLLEPPEEFRETAAACQNKGTWPVLVGKAGEHEVMLSSPIILYDYPEIAPESSGDLFDGTEIDEILTLRILTMTEDEKREMRYVDERARRLLERTETLSSEQMMKLHGTVRELRPLEDSRMNELDWHLLEDTVPLETVTVDNVNLKKGDRVRLRPRAGGDIFDMALAGKIAVIEAIEQDYENKVQLAVVLDDDPGKDLGMLRQPGHRFFFKAEEVEPFAPGGMEGLD